MRLTPDDCRTFNPDGQSTEVVLAYVHACASAWDPDARVLGNLRARDLLRAMDELEAAGRRAAGRRGPLLCTVCGLVPVDAEAGWDTCPSCAGRV